VKTSKTYIIAWDGAIENCLAISKQLVNGSVSHVFYNVSAVANQTQYWQTAEDARYYVHFFNAIRDFLSTDADVFIFNSGDIHYGNYAEYTARIEKLFDENDSLAAFAPNATNNVYSGWGSLIEDSRKYPKLYLSTNTDGLYTSLSREIAVYMSMFYDWSISTGSIDFSKMTSGWGLDHVYCSLALYFNKIIYRDRSVVVYHPLGQSYVQDIAIQEFHLTLQSFLKFAEDVLNIEPDSLRRIVNMTLGKIKDANKDPLGKEAIYTDLEAVRHA
jgi:hypothetical protein